MDETRATDESCPLCGEDVIPAAVQVQTGVPWGTHHHAHALCALETLAARVATLERVLSQLHPWRDHDGRRAQDPD